MRFASLCRLMNQLSNWLVSINKPRPMPHWMTRPRPRDGAHDPFATLEVTHF
jgi:hypothetical protein